MTGKIRTVKGHNIWVASGKLKSVVNTVFPFDKIVDAHRYLEASRQIGKIVVTI